MNLDHSLLLPLLGITLLSGCAIHDGRPSVATMDVPAQAKLKSAAHWQVVANDVASQIISALDSRDALSTPLWVSSATPKSTFSTVFASQLRSGLLQRGATVRDEKQSALEVSITVDEVRHVDEKRYRPGTLTWLTAEVLVIRQYLLHPTRAVGAGAITALGAGTDAVLSANELSRRPNTEIVMTTAIKRGGAFVMHQTDVYYIDDIDVGLFIPGREFKVVGGAA